MWNPYWSHPIFHMFLEDAWWVVPHRSTSAEMRHALLHWVDLVSYGRSGVICLVQVPFVAVCHHSRALRNRPLRLFNGLTWTLEIFRVVWSWSDDGWSRVQLNEWVESLNRSSSIKTILSCLRYLRSETWIVLWPWCQLIFLLFRWKSRLTTNPRIWQIEPPRLICLIDVKLQLIIPYIHIWSMVVLILGFRIEGIPYLCAYLPLWSLVVIKLIRHIIVVALWCCLT